MTNVLVLKNKSTQDNIPVLPSLGKVTTLMQGPFLTLYDFAAIAGYNYRYVWRLIKKGKLKSYKVGSRRLIAVTDAVEFGNQKKSANFLNKKAMIINSKGKLTKRK